MSDLDRFELFIYVAQSESITRAAASMNMSKAALSKQIKNLEEELKVDLFSRIGQRLQLTSIGKILLEQCLRLKRELDNARTLCQEFHQEPAGVLHVVAFEYFAKKLIFPKLKAFIIRYPKLELFIDTSERIPNFEQEQIDLAVGFSLPAPLEVVQRSMATTRYVLCASPGYFAIHGKPEALNDLFQHFYIGHRSRTDELVIKLKPPHRLSLVPNMYLNSVAAMIECAKADVGLIQLPLYMLEQNLLEGELIEVLTEYQATNANVYYYYPRYRYVQPKVRKFIDFFLED